MQHSIIPPSGSPQWSVCTGSVQLQAQFEQEPTEDTLTGEASHWVGSEVLLAFKTNNGNPIICSSYVGKTAPNGVLITEEMADAADMYVTDVLRIVNTCGGLQNLHIEERVEIPHLHGRMFGTPDAWLYDAKNNILYIWDYKYGHRFVEVYANKQLLCYTNGIYHLDEVAAFQPTINFRVVQPRCYSDYPVRDWTVKDISSLSTFWTELREKAHEALSDKATCITGTHCRDCTARHGCEALQKDVYAWMGYEQPPSFVELSPDAIATELDFVETAVEILTYRQTGLEEKAKSILKSGGRCGNRSLKQSYKRDTWVKTAEEIIALGGMFGIDLAAPKKAITPKQAVAKGIDESVIKSYSDTPLGELKLVKDNSVKAKRIFSK